MVVYGCPSLYCRLQTATSSATEASISKALKQLELHYGGCLKIVDVKKTILKKRLISLSEKEKRVEECLPPTRLLKFDYQTCAIKSIFFNVIITVLCLQRVALKLCYLLTCFVKCADPDICKIHIFPMDTCTRQAAWKICLKPAYFNCE